MAKKKSEPDVIKTSVHNQKFWLVCTVGSEPEVLFTVPLSIVGDFTPDRFFDIFGSLMEVLEASGRDPRDFDMFRYNPRSQSFAVKTRSASSIAAFFFDNMPWMDCSDRPIFTKEFLLGILGVKVKFDGVMIHEESMRVGSRELLVPVR